MQMHVRRWHPVAPGRCRRYTVPMTEPDQTPETPPPDEAPRDKPVPAPAAPRVRRGRWWLALGFVAALAFGAWGAWKTFAPADAPATTGRAACRAGVWQAVEITGGAEPLKK